MSLDDILVFFDTDAHWLEQEVIFFVWFLIICVMLTSRVTIAGHACQTECQNALDYNFRYCKKSQASIWDLINPLWFPPEFE